MLIPTEKGQAPFRKGKAMTMLNTTPRYVTPPIRRGVAVFLARLGRLVNRVIAAAIAHRERQANLVALRHLSDRDLKDIGIYRCEIGDALEERAQARQRMQRTQRSCGKSAASSNMIFKDKLQCAPGLPALLKK
jgi:uncharacterized protein YjiS (DUF1127 family)